MIICIHRAIYKAFLPLNLKKYLVVRVNIVDPVNEVFNIPGLVQLGMDR